MPRETNQKIKLLVLYDILKTHTDETHALSTEELVEILNNRGISVERRALIRDIQTLNDWGFEVQSYKRKSYYYFVTDRIFDVAELRILMDAVQSASFISEKRTQAFVDKIASLAGDQKAMLLKKNIVCYDTNKHNDNTYIFYSIDSIEEAIENKKKVSFLYFHYDTTKKKAYVKEKARYIVNPVALIFTNDNYYLVCYNDKYLNLSSYRVDRIEELRIEDEDITPLKKYENFNIHQYKKQAFSMFMGELQRVELEADAERMDEIIDRFGADVRVTRHDQHSFRVKVTVHISPPFFAWIVMLRGKVRICSPQTVKEQFRDFLKHEYLM